MTLAARVGERIERLLDPLRERVRDLEARLDPVRFEQDSVARGLRAAINKWSDLEEAPRVARDIERYVNAILDTPTIKRQVLEHRSLVEEWPLEPFLFSEREDMAPPGDPDRWPIDEFVWPIKVSLEEVSSALKATRDPKAKLVAAAIADDVLQFNMMKGGLSLFDKFERWRFDYDEDGNERETPSRLEERSKRILKLLPVLEEWSPDAVAVVLLIKKRVQEAYEQHHTVPTGVTEAIIRIRSGDLLKGTRPKLDPSGNTFPIPADGYRYWRFLPPKNTQLELSLPFEDWVKEPSPADVRSIVTGSRLRTWLATWVLAYERETPDGFFTWNPRHIILNIFGAAPEYTTSKGKRYERAPRDLERAIRKDFLELEKWQITGVRDAQFEKGEPLIHRYGEVRRYYGKVDDDELCAHARIAWKDAEKSFLQVPTKAFRLHADYTALVMGLAAVMRLNALGGSNWLSTGALRLPLSELAEQAGDDVKEGRRKRGRGYWSYITQRLDHVTREGGFGEFKAGVDSDGETLITITPSEPLATVYGNLAYRQQMRISLSNEATLRAEALKLLPGKRRPGRPRKSLPPAGK